MNQRLRRDDPEYKNKFPLHKRIVFFFKDLYYMTPRAIKYGFRYYYSKSFRRRVRGKEKRRYDKQMYGSGYLSSRRTIRQNLATRDGGMKCRWCGVRDDLSIDHIIPVSKGGTNNMDNLQILCRYHHVIKDNPNPTKEALEIRKFYEDKLSTERH